MTADLWNVVSPWDPVTEELINEKYARNEFALPISRFAIKGKAYSLACTRRKSFYYEQDPEKGWIMALGFTDATEAKRLVEMQIRAFLARGAREIWFSGFTPSYFLPGVDEKRNMRVSELLKEVGFRKQNTAIAMDKDLWPDVELPDEHNDNRVKIVDYDPKLRSRLLSFVSTNFTSDYCYRLQTVADKGENNQIQVALLNGQVAGYSMYSGTEGRNWFLPGEHFGPFGVDRRLRNKGIGSSLLRKTLISMRSVGVHRAYFLWTEKEAARLYSRFGFKKTREFGIYSLKL